jgi:hypothetical protein
MSEFVICISNEGNPVSLIVGKVYRRVTTYQEAPGQALSKTQRRHAPVAQAARPVFAG